MSIRKNPFEKSSADAQGTHLTRRYPFKQWCLLDQGTLIFVNKGWRIDDNMFHAYHEMQLKKSHEKIGISKK